MILVLVDYFVNVEVFVVDAGLELHLPDLSWDIIFVFSDVKTKLGQARMMQV